MYKLTDRQQLRCDRMKELTGIQNLELAFSNSDDKTDYEAIYEFLYRTVFDIKNIHPHIVMKQIGFSDIALTKCGANTDDFYVHMSYVQAIYAILNKLLPNLNYSSTGDCLSNEAKYFYKTIHRRGVLKCEECIGLSERLCIRCNGTGLYLGLDI